MAVEMQFIPWHALTVQIAAKILIIILLSLNIQNTLQISESFHAKSG